MIYSKHTWVKDAQQNAVNYMENRGKNKPINCIDELIQSIADRNIKKGLMYRPFNKIFKYNCIYENANYLLYKMIGGKDITAYKYLFAHTVISIYYELHANSLNSYNQSIKYLLSKGLEKHDLCYLRPEYSSVKCERLSFEILAKMEEEHKESELRYKERFKRRLEREYDFREWSIRDNRKQKDYCMLRCCDRCRKVSSSRWIHHVHWRKPESTGNVRERSLKEYWNYLCTGCRNKFRKPIMAQKIADENRYLINKLNRCKNEKIKKLRRLKRVSP